MEYLSACVAGWRDVVNFVPLVEVERMWNEQVAVWLVMVRYCLCGWVLLCVDVLAMCAVHSQKGSQSGSLDSFGLLFQTM